jgi:hypothetical protein
MSTLIEFVLVVLAIVIVTVVVSRAVRNRRRGALPRGESQRETAQTEDATGYMTGVWMLGGAESAAPRDSRGHQHAADAGGAHADPDGPHAGSRGHGGRGH